MLWPALAQARAHGMRIRGRCSARLCWRTLRLIRPGRLHRPHRHAHQRRRCAAAAGQAAQRGHSVVIAAPGQRDLALAPQHVVGRISSAWGVVRSCLLPAPSRSIGLAARHGHRTAGKRRGRTRAGVVRQRVHPARTPHAAPDGCCLRPVRLLRTARKPDWRARMGHPAAVGAWHCRSSSSVSFKTTTSAASQPHHKAWAGTDCGFRIALPPVLLSKAMRWVGMSAMDLFRVTADDAATPDFAVPLPRPIPTFPLTKQLFGC